jgi:hypothetical protein
LNPNPVEAVERSGDPVVKHAVLTDLIIVLSAVSSSEGRLAVKTERETAPIVEDRKSTLYAAQSPVNGFTRAARHAAAVTGVVLSSQSIYAEKHARIAAALAFT